MSERRSYSEQIKGMFGGRFRAGTYSAFAAVVVIATKQYCIYSDEYIW
jgi:hypothetical protein